MNLASGTPHSCWDGAWLLPTLPGLLWPRLQLPHSISLQGIRCSSNNRFALGSFPFETADYRALQLGYFGLQNLFRPGEKVSPAASVCPGDTTTPWWEGAADNLNYSKYRWRCEKHPFFNTGAETAVKHSKKSEQKLD